jgi:hypothetical protein
MLCISEDLCAKESDDMIRDDFTGLVLKVSVVDTEMRVEPFYFVGYELAWNETLGSRVSYDVS